MKNWYLVELKIAVQVPSNDMMKDYTMQYTIKKEVVQASDPRKAINQVLEDYGEFNGWDLIDIKKL